VKIPATTIKRLPRVVAEIKAGTFYRAIRLLELIHEVFTHSLTGPNMSIEEHPSRAGVACDLIYQRLSVIGSVFPVSTPGDDKEVLTENFPSCAASRC
jgi:hypothetical protein